jgi:hypothetical protein
MAAKASNREMRAVSDNFIPGRHAALSMKGSFAE